LDYLGWRAFIIKFEFCTYDKPKDIVSFTEEQKKRVLNVDETAASLDGSESIAGGRPEVTFSDPKLPAVAKSAAKSSSRCTQVMGSTAAGEPIPPHLQLTNSATAEEREKIRLDVIKHFKKIRG
jgi:hypothetical protein